MGITSSSCQDSRNITSFDNKFDIILKYNGSEKKLKILNLKQHNSDVYCYIDVPSLSSMHITNRFNPTQFLLEVTNKNIIQKLIQKRKRTKPPTLPRGHRSRALSHRWFPQRL